MTTERTDLFAKVNDLIEKRKKDLLDKLPSVHEVEDGIIIRFFAEWDACDDNNNIKYKRIINVDKPEEIEMLYYLPKGAYFEMKERNYISCMTCINGNLEIICNGVLRLLEPQTKICLDTNLFEGRALENTYLITTNCR